MHTTSCRAQLELHDTEFIIQQNEPSSQPRPCMARMHNSKSGWQEWELGRAFKLLLRKPEDMLCPNSFTV